MQDTEETIKRILQNIPLVVVVVDRDRRIKTVSETAVQFADSAAGKMIGDRSGEAFRCLNALDDPKGCGFGPECERCMVRHTVNNTFKTGKSHTKIEASLPVERDGKRETFRLLISTALLDEESVLLTMEDITERKRMEEELRRSEQRYRDFVEKANEGIWEIDKEGKTTYVNAKLCEMLGYSEEEIIGKPFYVYSGIKEETHCIELIKRRQEGIAEAHDCTLRRKDGQLIHSIMSAVPKIEADGCFIGATAYVTDITERKKITDRIEQELEEKEILLKEIHHRVKNNLNVVASLLRLQAEEIQTMDQAKHALAESQHRVFAMSLVHEKLYQSKSLAHIDIESFINSIIQDFNTLYSLSPRVSFKVKVDLSSLDITKATPCGLILNELLTNAIKHAFPENRSGTITVELTVTENNYGVLRVADDGVGLPEEIDIKNNDSLGLRLIFLLADQLEGEIRMQRKNGTIIEAFFPLVKKP